jgi:hypothetical protein
VSPSSNGHEKQWKIVSRKMGTSGNKNKPSSMGPSTRSAGPSTASQKSPSKNIGRSRRKEIIPSTNRYQSLSQNEDVIEEENLFSTSDKLPTGEQPSVQTLPNSNLISNVILS